ncbi:hypothetical protein P67b_00048 [Ruegeria phage Tedan]|nr:hypothetical protein P67b_00048 [Ruegeria phage Tedan]
MVIYYQNMGVIFGATPEVIQGAQLLKMQVDQAHAKWVRDGRPKSMQGFL